MRKKGTAVFLALLLTALLAVGMMPGKEQAVYAAETGNGARLYESIVNSMAAAPPTSYGTSDDPYGYGTNVPFTMSPANELILAGSTDIYAVPDAYDSFEQLTYQSEAGYDFLGSGTVNKNYPVYREEAWPGSYQKQVVNAPQAVSFDPTGSGRKDHWAELGVTFAGEAATLMLFVHDKNGVASAPYRLGSLNWMYGNTGVDYYNVKNFYSVTAGDYDGDGKDSLVIYGCLDGWNLGLYEVKVTSAGGNISFTKVNTSPAYQMLSLEYSNGAAGVSYFYVGTVNGWIDGTDVNKKLCGQVATGDFNGDRVDDLAVVTWHGGAFIGSYNESSPSSPYLAVNYGKKATGYRILSEKAAGTYTRKTCQDDNKYDYDSLAAPGLAAGDVNGDGRDDVIAAGYLKKVRDGDPGDGSQSVNAAKTAILTYMVTDEGFVEGPNKMDLETTDLMRMGFYTGDACMNHSTVEAVGLDGKGNPSYVFVNGLLAKVNGQSFDIYTRATDFDSRYGGSYYNARKSGFSNRWIDSAAVGNFDGDLAGTEEIVFSIGYKTSGKDKFQFDMGEIFGQWQTGAATQKLDFPMANTEGGLVTGGNSLLALTFVSVDNDNDGIVARYKDKGYVYSDPEVMAVLQAGPYFDELQDYLVDTNDTTYSISESFELEKGSSNSVSFGAGFTHNLEGTLGGYEVTAGYAMEWSEEFAESQTTSTTYSWSANFDDSVVVYRTPVVLYRYEIMQPDGSFDADHALTIAVPGVAAYQVLPVDDYNDFVDYYNTYNAERAAAATPRITTGIPRLEKITDPYLQHEGDPLRYRKTTDAGYKLLQTQPQSLSIGSSSTGFDYSKEAAFSTTESMSHGFSFELTITFGLNIPGFVESGAGGYTSLEYMHGNSVTRTRANGKGVSCTVFNVERGPLTAAGIDLATASEYGFNYQMASWDSNLTQTNSSQAHVPIYGFVLSSVRAGAPIVTDLEGAWNEDESAIDLSWSSPATTSRPVGGYVLYVDKGSGWEQAAELPASASAYTYAALEGKSDYDFLIKAKSSAGSVIEGIASDPVHLHTDHPWPHSIAKAKVTATDRVYDGKDTLPQISVTLAGKQLQAGTDYELKFATGTDRVQAGEVRFTVAGKGKYKGTVTGSYAIQPAKVKKPVAKTGLVYNGKTQTGVAASSLYTVKNGSGKGSLTEDTTYTAIVSLKDKANYTWADGKTADLKISWTIARETTEIAPAKVTGITAKTYTGKALTQSGLKVVLTVDGKPLTLKEGTDYTLSYKNNKLAGKATLTITGTGAYAGAITKTFTIKPAKVAVPTAKSGLTYNGAAQTGVAAGKGYTVTGGAATKAGTYTAKASLKDAKNYTWADGTTAAKSLKWTIAKASVKAATVTAIQDQDFTGAAVKPVPTVKLTVTQGSGQQAVKKTLTLKSGTDYTVSYKNNVNPGTASLTITGKGNFTGTLTRTFKIVKAKPAYERLAGDNRFLTSYAIADSYRKALGGAKLDTLVIADGFNFPDALAGAYLAAAKQAPILATAAAQTENTLAYARNNLKAGGQVYILGGTGSVSADLENKLKASGFQVTRLGGANRYLTNLLVLKAANVKAGQEFIVTTGADFADALSASATGKPLLLVAGNGLTADQKAYLSAVKPSRFTIVGTTAEVSEGVQKDLAAFATVRRIAGADAYVRSVNVAKTFFPGAQAHINLASGQNSADGLCGGPMAVLQGGPLLLTDNSAAVNTRIAAYVKAAGTTRASIFGGAGSVTEETVKQILAIN